VLHHPAKSVRDWRGLHASPLEGNADSGGATTIVADTNDVATGSLSHLSGDASHF
jgi:hypothetical protein